MAGRVRVVDIDHGYRALMASIRAFERQKPRLVTGIVGDAAAAPHAPRAPKTRQEKKRAQKRARDQEDIVRPLSQSAGKPALSIVEIARIHEYGLGKMPERSFLRANHDQNRDAYKRYLVAGVRRELLAAVAGQRVLRAAESVVLKRLALKIEGDIKKRIKGHIPPPNTPRTIRRKGSSTPLVDSGQLLGSIGSVLRSGTGGAL